MPCQHAPQGAITCDMARRLTPTTKTLQDFQHTREAAHIGNKENERICTTRLPLHLWVRVSHYCSHVKQSRLVCFHPRRLAEKSLYFRQLHTLSKITTPVLQRYWGVMGCLVLVLWHTGSTVGRAHPVMSTYMIHSAHTAQSWHTLGSRSLCTMYLHRCCFPHGHRPTMVKDCGSRLNRCLRHPPRSRS